MYSSATTDLLLILVFNERRVEGFIGIEEKLLLESSKLRNHRLHPFAVSTQSPMVVNGGFISDHPLRLSKRQRCCEQSHRHTDQYNYSFHILIFSKSNRCSSAEQLNSLKTRLINVKGKCHLGEEGYL